MRVVNAFKSDDGITLALTKAEIVIRTKKRMDTVVPLRVEKEVVQTRRVTKNFRSHGRQYVKLEGPVLPYG